MARACGRPHPLVEVIDANGTAVDGPALGVGLGEEPEVPRGWFTRLVRFTLRRRSRAPRPLDREPGETEVQASIRVIRTACIESAVSGAASAAATTSAAVLTAETGPLSSLATLPVAVLAVGGELLVRSVVHLRMTLELADQFGVKLDPDDPHDLWELFAVVLAEEPPGADTPNADRELVRRTLRVNAEEVGSDIGTRLAIESVLRNAVPFAGLAISSVTNWVQTKRLGDTVMRYVRYRRALDDAVATFGRDAAEWVPLLIEGIWFLFTADGRLRPEETATLTRLLRGLDHGTRAALSERFVDDELDWTERLSAVPEPVRDRFLSALEIAAAVDVRISLPERKILRRAARALGRTIDPSQLDDLMRAFAEVGVVAPRRRSGRAA